MPSLEDAKRVARVIAEKATESAQKTTFKLYIYGSSLNGSGNDIDLIIELPGEDFSQYTSRCLVVEDGIFPFSNQFLFPEYAMFWDYFSPKSGRSRVALGMIGVDIWDIVEALEIEVDTLDVICLPEGWNDPATEAFSIIKEYLVGSCDPNFLENAIVQAKIAHEL